MSLLVIAADCAKTAAINDYQHVLLAKRPTSIALASIPSPKERYRAGEGPSSSPDGMKPQIFAHLAIDSSFANRHYLQLCVLP